MSALKFDRGENRIAEVKRRRNDEEHGWGAVLLVHSSTYERVYTVCVCQQWGKKGKQGHNDECNEIVSLITVIISSEEVGFGDKSTGTQSVPSIDIWLITF